MGSYMPISIKSIIACGCLGAAILGTAACSPKRIPPMSVTDLMEDRVTLDGVLMKCNRNPSKARNDSDGLNARIAIERLASRNQPAEEAKRAEEFEHSREKLRLAQEKQGRNRNRRPRWTCITCRWCRSKRRPRPSPMTRTRPLPASRIPKLAG